MNKLIALAFLLASTSASAVSSLTLLVPTQRMEFENCTVNGAAYVVSKDAGSLDITCDMYFIFPEARRARRGDYAIAVHYLANPQAIDTYENPHCVLIGIEAQYDEHHYIVACGRRPPLP